MARPRPREQQGLLSRATAGDCLESSYFKEKPLRECHPTASSWWGALLSGLGCWGT